MAEQAPTAAGATAEPIAAAAATPESVAAAAATPGSVAAVAATPETAAATTSRGASLRAAYVLGLAIQVLIWFLIFLAIAVAVGAGGHLTQFRYVGF